MTNHALVIANPISGAGRGREILPDIVHLLDGLGYNTKVLETGGRGEAESITRELRDDLDLIVAAGGDGTISEGIAGLEGRPVPICVVPVGTANCLAGELGQTASLQEILKRLEAMRTESMDCFKFNGKYALLMVGVGLDGEVARKVCNSRRGTFRQRHYCLPTMATLLGYKFHRASLTIDGEKITDDATFIQVANTWKYGGPMVLVPQADRSDGMLDVLLVEKCSRLRYLWYLMQSAILKRVKDRGVRYFKGRRVLIESDSDVPCQVDGDYCGSLPMEIEIVPDSVRIVVNP